MFLRIKQLIYGTKNRSLRPLNDFIHPDITSLIGNTPIMELQSLSKMTGCRILAKLEFMNPGGSPKDRIALRIMEDAEREGKLKPGLSTICEGLSTICEGTVGSTGISLAMLAAYKKYGAYICMPSDQAKEKSDILEAYGAIVERVKPASIVDDEMFVRRAQNKARELKNGFFVDQFENESNFNAHYEETGPEIWEQCGGDIDALVLGAGTGGTIAGVSRYLKEKKEDVKVFLVDPPGSGLFNKVKFGKKEDVKVFLVDPPGSGLFNKVKFGVMFAKEEAEGTRKRHQVDTIVEGVGINRITRNFTEAIIDESFKITDDETIEMSRFLMKNEGLFVGSSSAINCVGAVKAAKELGPGHTIVTILCDSGQRHLTKFWRKDLQPK
ncbi:Cysteine synthase/cystathionine beta-synthase-like protein [Rozella allomycis CSF55]|uniref:Cysteine synthase/cystathionine beta-synthase-like protein n=1 Tax=Rozella allomycis (strain CSF55) TaxID=988480 RepID=A0A075AV73_ROZAC|nr:Cysteine synthase/cystathionine beta-synthase-like protein [Rozella allomycis CSF55]|eukprot:EPZ32577.1 Cysteine synthase/cystathionine beta-synthase-like protein [Rozella allomycis CSF55]